jgi:hypothetical protein
MPPRKKTGQQIINYIELSYNPLPHFSLDSRYRTSEIAGGLGVVGVGVGVDSCISYNINLIFKIKVKIKVKIFKFL